MLNYPLQDLARERQKSLLAQAEAAGRAREVSGDDATLLADGFARLSEQSRRMRFLFAKKILTPAELRYLTEVDHRDHEALGRWPMAPTWA